MKEKSKALQRSKTWDNSAPPNQLFNKWWKVFSRQDISPGISLERMMLKLKLQYFGHLMQRVDSLEKTLMLGGIGGRKRRGWPRMRWLDGITDSMDMVWVNSGSWWWTGRPGVLQFMGSQRVGHDWATELNWTFLQWQNYRNWEHISDSQRAEKGMWNYQRTI